MLDLYFSDYTIKGNGGTYEGCNSPMRNNYDLCNDIRFRNEKVWEIYHVLNSTQRTHRILGTNYQSANLSKIVSNSKHLTNN